MRKIFTVMALCMATAAIMAQKPVKVLDAAAARIRKAGNVQVKFTATTFEGSQEQGSTTGVILIKDKKMQLSTPEMRMWYDGKTQWSLITESGEVNVTNPTEKEVAGMHPYSFISYYKKGYRLSMKETTLRGQQAYEVHMTATDSSRPAQEIYVDVSKNDYTPMCIRIRQDGEWNRISVYSLQGGMDFPDSDFVFPSSEYKDVEIIDLR